MILQSSTPEARSPSDPGQSLGKRQGGDKPTQESSHAGKKAGREAAKRSAGKGGRLWRREEPKKKKRGDRRSGDRYRERNGKGASEGLAEVVGERCETAMGK
ncbi:hypothetical protein GW17_00013018 [Ensete ventricosum]|nr:hypothetical protein GW17_00013018 [Ensete ventricosum]RZR82893.1 hypothetical protein BHM03_00009420 [Ensete ventricosum]